MGLEDRPVLPLLRFADEDAVRLRAFKEQHPGIVIGEAEFGAGWDARMPLPYDGEGYFAPRPLGDLLDALEEELHTPP